MSKTEDKVNDFMIQVYRTVFGKMSLTEMVQRFGLPLMVVEYSCIEVLTGSSTNPTMKVDRIVGVCLEFAKDVVIRGVPKSFIDKMNVSGIVKKKVRHPTYKPHKMPKATETEMKNMDKNKLTYDEYA